MKTLGKHFPVKRQQTARERSISNQKVLERAANAKMRAVKHLSGQRDLSLIILKGHLLVEELLFAVVCSAVKKPEAIKSANLSFYQLASMAKALFYEDRLSPVWDAIFELNKLRTLWPTT